MTPELKAEIAASIADLIDAYLEACEATGWTVERDTVEDARAAITALDRPDVS